MGDVAPLVDTSSALARRARARTPGGVHSNVRLGGPEVFIARAKGAWMYSVDGTDYVDYLLGQGPNFLGHAPEPVLAAVTEATRRGMVYATQHPLEVEAAELVCESLGWAEMVRFGVSGTESVQAALRLARGATGRTRVIRFEGHYHGWLDNVLLAQREGRWGPASAGQLASHLDDFLLLPWNDPEALAQALARHGEEIAAVIMEPIMMNAGVIEPRPGYLAEVRRLCDEYGVVLIFDEVIAGFRLGPSGAAGRYRVTPDLAVYGKAMAGGWPVSALAGAGVLMERFGTGEVNHSGTFNSSVMAMAATVATLTVLRDDPPYQRVTEHGQALMAGIRQLAAAHGVPLRVQGLPVAFHVSFDRDGAGGGGTGGGAGGNGSGGIASGGGGDVVDFQTLQRRDLARYAGLAKALVEHGVWVAARGVWYVSASHGQPELEAALSRFDRTLSDWR